MQSIEMTYVEFLEAFKPETNPYAGNGQHAFALDGAEGVLALLAKPEYIFTGIDEDGEYLIVSGKRFINRLEYYVSTVPVPEGQSIVVFH